MKEASISELIAQAHAAFRDRDGDIIPGVKKLIDALIMQMHEIERLKGEAINKEPHPHD